MWEAPDAAAHFLVSRSDAEEIIRWCGDYVAKSKRLEAIEWRAHSQHLLMKELAESVQPVDEVDVQGHNVTSVSAEH